MECKVILLFFLDITSLPFWNRWDEWVGSDRILKLTAEHLEYMEELKQNKGSQFKKRKITRSDTTVDVESQESFSPRKKRKKSNSQVITSDRPLREDCKLSIFHHVSC